MSAEQQTPGDKAPHPLVVNAGDEPAAEYQQQLADAAPGNGQPATPAPEPAPAPDPGPYMVELATLEQLLEPLREAQRRQAVLGLLSMTVAGLAALLALRAARAAGGPAAPLSVEGPGG
jgi:hypothetical protein